MGGTDWKPEIPDKEKVNDSLNKILESGNSATEKAINLMLYLMRSQLFYDGNKRTSMMAANQVMIQNGAGIISVPIKYQEKFLELLVKFYETNNMDEIRELIYNHCIDGINFKRE